MKEEKVIHFKQRHIDKLILLEFDTVRGAWEFLIWLDNHIPGEEG